MADHEKFAEFMGSVDAKLDTLAQGQQEIKAGLYGAAGLEPRLRKVETTQARQKGYIAVAMVVSGFIGRYFPKWGG